VRGSKQSRSGKRPGRRSIVPSYTLTNPKIRVVVRPSPEASAEEELLVLRAMELLKMGHDQLRLEYVTARPEIARLLRRRWFLAACHLGEGDPFFDEMVDIDVGLTLENVERDAMRQVESDLYDASHQKALEQSAALQRRYDEAGMKDLKAPVPEHRFIPRWHKGNAYLWQLLDELGLPIDIPGTPLVPFNDVPAAERERVLQILAKQHITDKWFAVFDFRGATNPLPAMQMLAQLLPDHRLVSVAEITNLVGDDIVSLMAVFSHAHCDYVVGDSGPMTYAAWAVNVPFMVQYYDGEDLHWDGARAKSDYPLSKKEVGEDLLPQGIRSGITYLHRMSEL
jgi:hypothetical protein